MDILENVLIETFEMDEKFFESIFGRTILASILDGKDVHSIHVCNENDIIFIKYGNTTISRVNNRLSVADKKRLDIKLSKEVVVGEDKQNAPINREININTLYFYDEASNAIIEDKRKIVGNICLGSIWFSTVVVYPFEHVASQVISRITDDGVVILGSVPSVVVANPEEVIDSVTRVIRCDEFDENWVNSCS